jgi:hypothetical protein
VRDRAAHQLGDTAHFLDRGRRRIGRGPSPSPRRPHALRSCQLRSCSSPLE